MFKIISVLRLDSENVAVKVRCDAKEFNKIKAKGDLGQLYGIDISNEVYRTRGVTACNPTVDSHGRVRNGYKWVTLIYKDDTWDTYKPILNSSAESELIECADTELKQGDQIEYVNNVIHVDFINKKRKVYPIAS